MSIFLIKICLLLCLIIGTILLQEGNCAVNCRKFPFHSECRGVWAFSKKSFQRSYDDDDDLSYDKSESKFKHSLDPSENFEEYKPKSRQLYLRRITRTHENQI